MIDYGIGALIWLAYPISQYFWQVLVIGLVAVIVILLRA